VSGDERLYPKQTGESCGPLDKVSGGGFLVYCTSGKGKLNPSRRRKGYKDKLVEKKNENKSVSKEGPKKKKLGQHPNLENSEEPRPSSENPRGSK